MREIDRRFLILFKDLKIVPDKQNPGTENKPNFHCYIGKESISYATVLKMVKEYQDAIVDMLLKEQGE